jgi:hypothetical protein
MSQAEDLARAALQGFFDTPEFRDMTNAGRRRAVRRVQELWAQQQAEEAYRQVLLARALGFWGRLWNVFMGP